MILEILKYTIPALIVFLTAYLLIDKLLKNERDNRKVQVVLNNQKTITPIRIQAYERMVLFLERISPQSLVLRTQSKGMKNQELQGALLKTIRFEFEHNMAHQLYISDQAWEKVKAAKENLVKLINQMAIGVKPEGPAIQLSQLILEKMLDKKKDPTIDAINYLKSEIRTLF